MFYEKIGFYVPWFLCIYITFKKKEIYWLKSKVKLLAICSNEYNEYNQSKCTFTIFSFMTRRNNFPRLFVLWMFILKIISTLEEPVIVNITMHVTLLMYGLSLFKENNHTRRTSNCQHYHARYLANVWPIFI